MVTFPMYCDTFACDNCVMRQLLDVVPGMAKCYVSCVSYEVWVVVLSSVHQIYGNYFNRGVLSCRGISGIALCCVMGWQSIKV